MHEGRPIKVSQIINFHSYKEMKRFDINTSIHKVIDDSSIESFFKAAWKEYMINKAGSFNSEVQFFEKLRLDLKSSNDFIHQLLLLRIEELLMEVEI